MLRLFDWECSRCRAVSEHLVDSALGRATDLLCTACKRSTLHARLLSIPAPYMGERVENVAIHGGSCDTMGNKRLPKLPPLPGVNDVGKRFGELMRQAGPDATPEQERAAYTEASKHAPDYADCLSTMNRPEYREIEKERKRVSKENKQKRKRAAAIARGGNVNMRRDKCAGDPKL